jgi:hypothetical protein
VRARTEDKEGRKPQPLLVRTRALTDAEKLTWRANIAKIRAWRTDNIDRRLAGVKCVWERSSGAERHRHLLAAVVLCGSFRPLPDWAVKPLCDEVASRLLAPPKDRLHHHVLRAFLDLGYGWEEALQLAVEKFAELGNPVSERTLRGHYANIEKALPEKARRPRTYSRHRRSHPLGQN